MKTTLFIRRYLLGLLCFHLGSTVIARQYDFEVSHGIVYQVKDNERLRLDVYRPMAFDGLLPVVLAVHGGFWRQVEMRNLTYDWDF